MVGEINATLQGSNVHFLTNPFLPIQKLFERDMSVSLVLTSAFKTTLALVSYCCRWASCRGSVPQPVVVFVLAASAVCAPRRKRLMTIALTLVAMRTLAEALHGYVQGNEDWEDDTEVDNKGTNLNQQWPQEEEELEGDC